MQPSYEQLKAFLQAVDRDFPVPLSAKQNLDDFARKLLDKATICATVEGDRIVSLAAGYTERVEDGLGYISVVATLPEARGRRLGAAMVQAFVRIAAEKNLRAVHLYAVADNLPAIRMYQRLGFTAYHPEHEARPEDAHLIYYIQNEV